MLCRAQPAVTSLGLFLPLLTSIPFTKISSTSAGGKDLSNDTQNKVIVPVEPEICTKMLKKLSEKLRAKFLATIRDYAMVKITHLDDAFQNASQQKVNHCSKKKRKGKKKKKSEKTKSDEKPKDVGHLYFSSKNSNFRFLRIPASKI